MKLRIVGLLLMLSAPMAYGKIITVGLCLDPTAPPWKPEAVATCVRTVHGPLGPFCTGNGLESFCPNMAPPGIRTYDDQRRDGNTARECIWYGLPNTQSMINRANCRRAVTWCRCNSGRPDHDCRTYESCG